MSRPTIAVLLWLINLFSTIYFSILYLKRKCDNKSDCVQNWEDPERVGILPSVFVLVAKYFSKMRLFSSDVTFGNIG